MNVEAIAGRLRDRVEFLAGRIGERNVYRPKSLRAALEYLEEVWRRQGYDPRRQTYQVDGIPCSNVEVERRGTTRADEIVLVGAHYDSVVGSPGANDNASGVAAMLEVSAYFAAMSPERTVRCVAFVNEEPPFYRGWKMGSQVYARAARKRRDDIRAMFSLETIGFYRDEPGSQGYPPLFRFFYPKQGNFVAFVSNLRSRRLLRRAVEAFRRHSDFPVERCAALSIVPGISWSDHSSFWKYGYRAVMVTDTAFYRYPYYHTAQDKPHRLHYRSLARVTAGLTSTVESLATAARGLD
jgi:Zn-dependent M28 family amino/carboxypeptidase